jgi:hypothetical protein
MATFRATLMPYAAGLAAVLALSGCGDGEERAAPGVSVPSTPSVTSSSVTTAPTAAATTAVDPALARIPPAARPNTRAGAEAFARFFYDQASQSWAEGDPAPMDGLYRPECKACKAFRETAAHLKSEHQRYNPAPLKVGTAGVISYDQDAQTEVAVRSVGVATEVVTEQGATVRKVPADGPITFVATMVFDNRWIVIRSQVELKQ